MARRGVAGTRPPPIRAGRSPSAPRRERNPERVPCLCRLCDDFGRRRRLRDAFGRAGQGGATVVEPDGEVAARKVHERRFRLRASPRRRRRRSCPRTPSPRRPAPRLSLSPLRGRGARDLDVRALRKTRVRLEAAVRSGRSRPDRRRRPRAGCRPRPATSSIPVHALGRADLDRRRVLLDATVRRAVARATSRGPTRTVTASRPVAPQASARRCACRCRTSRRVEPSGFQITISAAVTRRRETTSRMPSASPHASRTASAVSGAPRSARSTSR